MLELQLEGLYMYDFRMEVKINVIRIWNTYNLEGGGGGSTRIFFRFNPNNHDCFSVFCLTVLDYMQQPWEGDKSWNVHYKILQTTSTQSTDAGISPFSL